MSQCAVITAEPFSRRPRVRLCVARWRYAVAPAVLVLVAFASVGCEREPAPPRYDVLAGKVLATYPETGELAMRVVQRTSAGVVEQTVACVVTGDSEIYVNDKLAELADIQIGDPVEFIGYFDPDPRMEKFVVTFAYFEHSLPPPPRPDLTPATQPIEATRPTPN